MEVFLRLKHWHVFMLGFGLFVISFTLVSLIEDMVLHDEPLANSDTLLRVLLFVQTLCIVIANFWLYAVGNYLHKSRYLNSFALLLFRLCIYFSTFFNITRYVVFPAIDFFDVSYNELGMVLSLMCSIYCSYIAARLLNSVEEQKDVWSGYVFRDALGFLFYPIGVWWLQPRINNVYNNDKDVVLDPDAPLDQGIR